MAQVEDTFSAHPTRGLVAYQPGMAIGAYALQELLGQGGMGQVWKAHDTQGNRLVAIKLLPPEFRGNEEAIAQVRTAFEAVHDLTHQGLCKILALVEDPQHGPYIVMDFFPGITLSKYRRSLPEGQLSLEQVLRVLRPVAEALDFVHQRLIQTGDRERRGVLHRDVKPQNIMVCPQGNSVDRVCLIDLGLAAEIRSTVTRFTQANVDTRGTRPYMSPEQMAGKRGQWDGRTDQYSLAVVAYELLAGHLPFEGDDLELLLLQIKNELPDKISGLADSVNAALLKGLSRNKEDRFATCGEFVTALTADCADQEQFNDRTKERNRLNVSCQAHRVGELARLEGSCAFKWIAFSPDGTRILTGDTDKKVSLWDTQSNRATSYNFQWQVDKGTFSVDGTRYCVVGQSSTLVSTGIWGKVHKKLFPGYHRITSNEHRTVWDNGDSRLEQGGHYAIWDIGRSEASLEGVAPLPIDDVLFSADGNELVLSICGDLRVLDARPENRRRTLVKLTSQVVRHSSFSADRRFALGLASLLLESEGLTTLIDLSNNTVCRRMPLNRKWLNAVSCPPQHSTLLVWNKDEVKLVDLESGKETVSYSEVMSPVTSVAVSPDGSSFLSRSPHFLQMLEVHSGREIHRFELSGSTVTSYSPTNSAKTVLQDGPMSSIDGVILQTDRLKFSPCGGCAAIASGKALVMLGLPK